MNQFFKTFCIFLFYIGQIHAQEGFCASTLIATPSGYQRIENIMVGDVVYDHNFEQKIVTNTCEYYAYQYVQLQIQGHEIACALHQKLYLPWYDAWLQACDLALAECDSIKIVHQLCMIHCITVQDHVFCVTPCNFIVHNSAAIQAAPLLVMHYIQLGHPVLILLGSTLCLYYINSCSSLTQDHVGILYQPSQETVYFENKYQQLEALKKNCQSIHTAVKAIATGSLNNQYQLLDCKELFRYKNWHQLRILPEYEYALDFEQRLELTAIREKILYALEAEICNLQIAIGLFVDNIISARNETVRVYNDYIDKIAHGIHQQAHFNGSSYAQAASYYEYVLTCCMYIDCIEKRSKECFVLIEFFKKYAQHQLIFQTTTIVQSLTDVQESIKKSEKIIDTTKKDKKIQLQSVQDYFYHYPPAPNIAHKITVLQQELQAKIDAQSKQQSFSYPKKPESHDDDDSPRWYEHLSKHPNYYTPEQAEKYLARGISPSPQHGQEALDRSIQLHKGARASVENNFIVIFYRTRILPEGGSIYHSFITTFENLEKEKKQPIINKLINTGLIKPSGKIV